MALSIQCVSTGAGSWVSQLEAKRSSFLGSTKSIATSAAPIQKRAVKGEITCSADAPISRRDALLLASIAAAGIVGADKPALAAYGQPANVFGKSGKGEGVIDIKGDGFSIGVPAKWNPSKEKDFPNVALRWEDNFDAFTHVVVLKLPATKGSIDAYGSPEVFAQENAFLLGEQAAFNKVTGSEGGFDKGKVQKANILTSAVAKEGGTSYYKYEILTTTADGTEGGRHILITAAVKNGSLYICKSTAGDKRWFKGAEKLVRSVDSTFRVA